MSDYKEYNKAFISAIDVENINNKLLGGYCDEVPPLPIPNREVKLICADGTTFCGRVGHRHPRVDLIIDPFFI